VDVTAPALAPDTDIDRAQITNPTTLVSIGHIRVHAETGANPFLLWVAVVTTLVVLVRLVFTTLIREPALLVTLLVVVTLSMALDMACKRSRDRRQVVSYAAGVPAAPSQAVRVVRARIGHRVATSHVIAPANIPMAAPPTTSTGQCAPM
jgi:hypothetical protein